MEPMGGGLDQQINEKVDAYRSNPQALQQRYQQNQQLIDLLALQKLKSEKDAAARDMQMKMQQQPQTIKQQREAELMQRTKDDMVKQTAGVMQQKQAQQQKNMQRAAQGQMPQQRPQMPMAQQAGGLGGLPMPKMAAGGIVAFQGGGLSSMSGLDGSMSLEDQLDIIRKRTDLNDAQKASLMEQVRTRARTSPDRQFTTPVGRASSARMPGVQGLIPVGSETSALDVMAETSPQIAPTRAEPTKVEPDLGGLGLGPSTRPRNMNRPQTDELVYSGRGGDPRTPTEDTGIASVAPTGTAPTGGGITSGMPAVGGGDPRSALQEGLATADAYTGRQAKSDRYDEMIAKLKAFDEETYDPEEERRDQLKSFLIGAGGTGSLGTTAKAAASASMGLRAEQKANRRKRLLDVYQLEKDKMGTDTALAQYGLSLGKEMFSQASQDRRNAQQIMASMRNTDVRAAVEQSRQALERMKSDRSYELGVAQNALKASELAITQARNDATDRTNRIDDILDAQSSIMDAKDALRSTYLEMSPIPMLLIQLQDPDLDKDEATAIKTRIKDLESTVTAAYLTAANELGLLEREEELQSIYSNLTSGYSTDDLVK